MRVEPDVADFFFVFAKVPSNARGDSSGDGMVSAKNEGQKSLPERFLGGLGDVCTGFSDLLQILGALFADGHFFWLFDFEVADVLDRVPEFLDCGLQARSAQRRGPHIHATAALAQVHGHTNDSYFLRHFVFRVRWPGPCGAVQSATRAPGDSPPATPNCRGTLRIHPKD